MPVVQWTPDLSVGNAELDGHHRRLIELLDEVHTVMRSKAAQETVGRVLEELVRYAAYHFAAEERLMEAAGCPLLDEHRRSHDTLSAQVQEMLRQYAEDPRSVYAAELFEFLSDWLIHHIRSEDMRYKPWMGD